MARIPLGLLERHCEEETCCRRGNPSCALAAKDVLLGTLQVDRAGRFAPSR